MAIANPPDRTNAPIAFDTTMSRGDQGCNVSISSPATSGRDQTLSVNRCEVQGCRRPAIKTHWDAVDQKPVHVCHHHALATIEPIKNPGRRIGRNEPCPCASGRKFKKCCLLKVA